MRRHRAACVALAAAFAFSGSLPSATRAANYASWANAHIYDGAHDPTQQLMSWWGMDHAIISTGIHAIIAMADAAQKALNGQLQPVASYVVSTSITAETEQHFASQLSGTTAESSDHTGALEYIRSRFAAYVADAHAQNEPAANLATACAYFGSTAMHIEFARELTSAERRALRGGCVIELAGREAGLGQFRTERERQSTAEILMLVGAIAQDEYDNAKSPEQREKVRSNVEARFKEYFDVPLRDFPIDNIACAGIKPGTADERECRGVPNAKFIAVADNTR